MLIVCEGNFISIVLLKLTDREKIYNDNEDTECAQL